MNAYIIVKNIIIYPLQKTFFLHAVYFDYSYLQGQERPLMY